MKVRLDKYQDALSREYDPPPKLDTLRLACKYGNAEGLPSVEGQMVVGAEKVLRYW